MLVSKEEELTNKRNLYVKQGKRLLEEIGTYQAEIAKMAVEVCDIRHGGKTKEKIYTMKDFAQDLGMKPKTLQGWVATYRDVVVKAGIEIKDVKDWGAATKTNNALKKERTLQNKLIGAPKKKGSYKKGVAASKVKSLYESIRADEKPFITELVNLTQSAKHIKFILGKRDLNIAEDAKLTDLMNILDSASDLINDHLTKKMPRINRMSAKEYKLTYVK